MNRLVFLFIALFCAYGQIEASFSQRILCKFFGNEPIKSERIKFVLKDANEIVGVQTVGYCMDDRAKSLGFSSFTWAGATWFDENAVERTKDELLLFEVAHETAHHSLRHDLKFVAAALACVVVPCLVTSSHGIKVIGSLASLAYVIPCCSIVFEGNAIATAAEALIKKGRINIVTAYHDYLLSLKKQSFSFATLLFPSIHKIIALIDRVTAEHTKK
jgi:hypothetical protein